MAKIEKETLPYTQIKNRLLNDKDISLRAKGLYAFMYSKPNNWNFTIKSMSSQLKEGYDAIQTALKELKEKGWIAYTKQSNGNGIYTLHVEPKTEKPKLDNPIMGKPVRISNKDIISNKDSYKEKSIKKEKINSFIENLTTSLKENKLLTYEKKINNTDKTKQYFKQLNENDLTKVIALYTSYIARNKKLAARLDKFLIAYLENNLNDIEYSQPNQTKSLHERNTDFINNYFKDDAVEVEVLS